MFIRLDRKGRLVLPLEIRYALGLKKQDELQLDFVQNGSSVTAFLSRQTNSKSRLISKNIKEVEKNEK